MSVSDWIQVVAILVSLAVSIVSILQTRKSIKNTEKSIKDANRPYLSIYFETIDTIDFGKYIVLKNFGKTSAKILDITVDGSPKSHGMDIDFSSMIGATISPGQKFSSVLENDFSENLFYSIVYQESDGEVHNDSFSIKTDMNASLPWKHKSSKDLSTTIKNATQAIIKSFK